MGKNELTKSLKTKTKKISRKKAKEKLKPGETLQFQGMVAMMSIDKTHLYLNPKNASKSPQVAPICLLLRSQREIIERGRNETIQKSKGTFIAIADPFYIALKHQWKILDSYST